MMKPHSRLKLDGFRDITPRDQRCLIGNCPAIFEVNDGYVLVGTRLSQRHLPETVRERIGQSEDAILVPRSLLRSLIRRRGRTRGAAKR